MFDNDVGERIVRTKLNVGRAVFVKNVFGELRGFRAKMLLNFYYNVCFKKTCVKERFANVSVAIF